MAWKRVYVTGKGYRWTDGKGNYRYDNPAASEAVKGAARSVKNQLVKIGRGYQKAAARTSQRLATEEQARIDSGFGATNRFKKINQEAAASSSKPNKSEPPKGKNGSGQNSGSSSSSGGSNRSSGSNSSGSTNRSSGSGGSGGGSSRKPTPKPKSEYEKAREKLTSKSTKAERDKVRDTGMMAWAKAHKDKKGSIGEKARLYIQKAEAKKKEERRTSKPIGSGGYGSSKTSYNTNIA